MDEGQSRREFIRIAAAAAAAFAAACRDDPEPPASEGPECKPSFEGSADAGVPDLPHLGGAPDTDHGRAIAAFVDTIVPGAHRDPTGAPGALDAGGAAAFFDPELPALAFVPLLVSLLDSFADELRPGATFVSLTPSVRELAVEQATEVEQMGFAVQLAKLSYYASAPAACHLGYPGPNPGYYDHPDFTFGEAVTTEITDDGNYP